MTFLDSIAGLTPYTIPEAKIIAFGDELGIAAEDDVASIDPRRMNGARARLYLYLATVPNVSEGGVSITFTPFEKQVFFNRARHYAALAGENGLAGIAYGYKGENI